MRNYRLFTGITNAFATNRKKVHITYEFDPGGDPEHWKRFVKSDLRRAIANQIAGELEGVADTNLDNRTVSMSCWVFTDEQFENLLEDVEQYCLARALHERQALLDFTIENYKELNDD